MVLTAGRNDTARAHEALARLCQTYWYPLYAYVRRCGHSPEDAQDLTQDFFAQLLAHHWVARADRQKGRFRSFLLIALKRFLANAWDKARARKRGGGVPPISLDALTPEQRYALEPTDRLSADRLFERRWALTLLDAVLTRLREEQAAGGRVEAFDLLKDSLTAGARATPYAELAARLHTSEGAVKVAVHRLRRRYRELLETEIAHTVSSADEVTEERRYLFSVLSG